jgi:hypothetical protein
MNPAPHWRAEERRFLEHLNSIGYTTDGAPDPHGWHFVTNPMAPPLGFRAGPHFLCLHAQYPAGRCGAEEYHDLLREVNRLNAAQWLVRCALVTREEPPVSQLFIRLQANLPMGLPRDELGACLLTWIRESTQIERCSRLRAWATVDTNITEKDARTAVDDFPPQAT